MNLDDLRQTFPHASAAFLRANAVQPAPTPGPAHEGRKSQAKRIRQHAGDGMNRWEREYSVRLKTQWEHVYREVSLPLANGLRYKVDFLVVSPPSLHGRAIEGHEVKGFARSTGIAKLKMAASLYPFISFKLVTRRPNKLGGGWDIQRVLP